MYLLDAFYIKAIGENNFSLFRYNAITFKLNLTFWRGPKRIFVVFEGRWGLGIRTFIYSPFVYLRFIS